VLGGWSSEEEEVDKCESKPVLSFIEAYTAFEISKSCLHMHSIGECNRIFGLTVGAVFCVKHIVSTQQLTVTDLFVRK
jgi:hypothetical protein